MKKSFYFLGALFLFLASCTCDKGEIAVLPPSPPPNTPPVTVTIQVTDNMFNPVTATATVGDTILWNWASGVSFHTTTSTSVPAGAASWDSTPQSGPFTYTYVITQPGTYNYQCAIHAPGMAGTINVTQ